MDRVEWELPELCSSWDKSNVCGFSIIVHVVYINSDKLCVKTTIIFFERVGSLKLHLHIISLVLFALVLRQLLLRFLPSLHYSE